MMETECIDSDDFFCFVLKYLVSHGDGKSTVEEMKHYDIILFILDQFVVHFNKPSELREGDPMRRCCAGFVALAAECYPDLLPEGKKMDSGSKLDEYRESPAWKAIRVAKLKEVGFRCQVCNSSENLHVCHRNWSRLFHEELDDLVVLCKSCHDLFRANKKLANEPEAEGGPG